MKYTIAFSEGDIIHADSFADAKYRIAEMLLARERSVALTTSEHPGKSFRAELRHDNHGEPSVIFIASWHPANPGTARATGELEYAPDIEFIDADLERARRVAIYAAQMDCFTKRHARSEARCQRGRCAQPVIEIASGREFGSLEQAAEFAGITHQSMWRRVRTSGSGWVLKNKTQRTAIPGNVPPRTDDIESGNEIRSDLESVQGASTDAGASLSSDTEMAI